MNTHGLSLRKHLRPLHAHSFALGALLIFGCAACPAQVLVVAPGKIVDKNGWVSGSFKLTYGYTTGSGVATWKVGIASLGHGGGCLVTDLGETKLCSNDAECPKDKIDLKGGYGYCVQLDASAPKSCWYKGDDAKWCYKKKVAGPPLNLGETIELPVPYWKGDIEYHGINAAFLHNGREARYMVITCLNGYDEVKNADVPDCPVPDDPPGLNRLIQYGKPTKVLGLLPPPLQPPSK